MKARAPIFFLLGIVAFMIYAVISSLEFRYWEAKILPLFIACAVLVLTLLELKAELQSEDKKTEDATPERPSLEEEGHMELRRFISVMGWTLGFCMGSYLLGFLTSIPLFTFSYLKVHKRSWFTSLGVAAVLSGFIYLAFEFGLSARLFPGVIFGG